jgi:hypothetical protein
MKKSIDRTFELSAEEAKAAIWRYLKESCDQPVPPNWQDLTIKWNAPGDCFVSYHERIDLETGQPS